jgi:MoaA/NifB/PqqE/SkfB family radical SAM enzyme
MGAQVLENIQILRDLGAYLIVAIVVTRHNIGYVEESIRNLAGVARHFHLMTVQDVRSVEGIRASYQFAQDREEEFAFWHRISRLEEECGVAINTPLKYEGERGCASGAPCMAAFSHLVIDPSLKARPCDRLTDVVIGDLKETSVLGVWHGAGAQKIIESPIPYCKILNKSEADFCSAHKNSHDHPHSGWHDQAL